MFQAAGCGTTSSISVRSEKITHKHYCQGSPSQDCLSGFVSYAPPPPPAMPKPAALGKGLGALINVRVASPTPIEEKGERVQAMKLSQIVPTPLQPRTVFRDDNLDELVDSIRQ